MSLGHRELARAKVNLTLHVGATIKRGKWMGYHPVESLVVFADFGDVLQFGTSEKRSVNYIGPFSKYFNEVDDGQNSVLKLSRLLSLINKFQWPLDWGAGQRTPPPFCAFSTKSKIFLRRKLGQMDPYAICLGRR
jgi:hypothetical protein